MRLEAVAEARLIDSAGNMIAMQFHASRDPETPAETHARLHTDAFAFGALIGGLIEQCSVQTSLLIYIILGC